MAREGRTAVRIRRAASSQGRDMAEILGEQTGEGQSDEGQAFDGQSFDGQGQSDESLVAGTLAYLARSLVDHPDDVRVTVEPGHPRTVVRLDVHPDDTARVIGRGGRVARSLRALTKVAAARVDMSVHVQIGDARPPRTDASESLDSVDRTVSES